MNLVESNLSYYLDAAIFLNMCDLK